MELWCRIKKKKERKQGKFPETSPDVIKWKCLTYLTGQSKEQS